MPTTYRIEVWTREQTERPPTDTIERIETARLFFLGGELTFQQVWDLTRLLLADPVTEDYVISRVQDVAPPKRDAHTIEVTLLPGVTDPVAESLLWAAHLTGFEAVEQTATGARYRVYGVDEDDLEELAWSIFANDVIEQITIDHAIRPPFVPVREKDATVEVISVRDLSDVALEQLSQSRRLALNLDEMQAIRAYYEQEGRDPTDAELEMLAQTWSEHCVHKTFKAHITYEGPEPGTVGEIVAQEIPGLLATYIRAATEELDKEWVHSAFVDNAGIIAFTDDLDIAFKVETHNHPSALEPFGGANTGIGGVVRDVLGVSARPIANTDILCFGPTDIPTDSLPEGVLHPARVERGVIHGIEDYGNKMGIPTVNGSILYHRGYLSNPLVYCGCLGILPRGAHPTDPQPNDLIVVLGGRTGRDGLRGATFSSMEMDEATQEIAGSAVQIGHPINEKQVLEVVLQARDEGLYNAITDCGAGGLSSAVGEMGEHIGARVQLADVPLKYPGLRPWEIWLSEAQERMVMAVPAENWQRLQAIAAMHQIDVDSIGTYEPNGRLTLYYEDEVVGDLSMEFLHDGLPPRHMEAVWEPRETAPVRFPQPETLDEALLNLLAHPTIASKEEIVRRYDHEVQGGTVVKPLVGLEGHGPGDSTVLLPLDVADGTRGVALSNGINPLIGEHDPYAMAWAAVDEAMRNLVATGADPERTAILDNFCWGSPSLPDRLGALVRCAQGCYDAALAYQTPYISGKDSLNNEFTDEDGNRHAIPGTLLISAVGIVPDVRTTTTSALKAPGNLLYIIGESRDELGGSHYAALLDDGGGTPPQPPTDPLNTLKAVHKAIGTVQACHDCSEGGIAVALAEMCIGGRLGAHVDLATIPGAENVERSDGLLFGESLTRFIVEVRPEDVATLEGILGDVPHAHIGRVLEEPTLFIQGWEDGPIVTTPVEALERAFRGQSEPIAPAPAQFTEQTTPPLEVPAVHAQPPKVAILHAKGTNRDRDAALACEMAGGEPEIVRVTELVSGARHLLDYHMVVIPGGFSFGDDLGAGQVWAVSLQHQLGDVLHRYMAEERPVLGICNGFQVLVKAGLLPGDQDERTVTLAHNESERFECRWVYLQPNPLCDNRFITGLDELIHCPVAHGEGRVAVRSEADLTALHEQHLIALRYVDAHGSPVGYPGNPNGSVANIAGLSNAAGNVLGLMPHPENHIFPWQHPERHHGVAGQMGLRLFENGLRAF